MKSMLRVFVLSGSAACLLVLSACDGGSKPAATSAKSTPRETIRKTTQEVMRLQDALAEGGQLAEKGGEIGPDGGYLGTVAKAYRSSVGSLAIGQVQQMMQIYDIQNNGPVKDYDEFMSAIIKKGQPDGIQLPMLPYYQEYAYDEANRQLVVVEFPKRQQDFEKQQSQ